MLSSYNAQGDRGKVPVFGERQVLSLRLEIVSIACEFAIKTFCPVPSN